MPNPIPIASLWIGPRLSWVEQLSLRSFQAQGHEVTLYTLGPLANVPEGVAVRSADKIIAPPFPLNLNARKSMAVYADIFRLALPESSPALWVDLDTVALRSIPGETQHIFGRSGAERIQNSTLRLPTTSPARKAMLNFLLQPNPIQPWRGPRFHRMAQERVQNGERWTIEDLPWGCSGPKALTHFLKANGEITHAWPERAFHHLTEKMHPLLFGPHAVATQFLEGGGVYSLHLFGVTKTILQDQHEGLAPAGSYLAELCHRHSIDPERAQIIDTPK